MRRAGELVAPGGVVTYAVCTITRAETVGVLDEVLAGGGWRLDDLGAEFPGGAPPARRLSAHVAQSARHERFLRSQAAP